jgi:hypothetical protein
MPDFVQLADDSSTHARLRLAPDDQAGIPVEWLDLRQAIHLKLVALDALAAWWQGEPPGATQIPRDDLQAESSTAATLSPRELAVIRGPLGVSTTP